MSKELGVEDSLALTPPAAGQEEFPANVTIGDKYRPAMEITEQSKADAYFERCVRHCMGHGRTREEAESIEKANLGYFAGYYDHETMARVNRLYRTRHPIFGGVAPTPEQALEAGKKLGAALVSSPNPTEVKNG